MLRISTRDYFGLASIALPLPFGPYLSCISIDFSVLPVLLDAALAALALIAPRTTSHAIAIENSAMSIRFLGPA